MMLETEIFQIDPDITGVSCAGRFTMGTRLSQAEAMLNSLIWEGTRKLVLDLTHVEFVDSAGLGVIMHVFGELEQLGGRMRVAGASGQALRLFQITHTEPILAIDPDLVTSVKKLQADEASAAAK
jgi:anti-sigma B factor antagonist